MKQYFALFALALLPSVVKAECMEKRYTFEGQVVLESGKPAVGAFVGASWIEYGHAGGPAIAVTNSAGRFRLLVRFTPGDDLPIRKPGCLERITNISIIAYKDNLRSRPRRVQITHFNQILPTLEIAESAIKSPVE